MSKQGQCRICKQRPPWKGKNCPPNICKRCYHRHIWSDRPEARKQRQAPVTPDAMDDVIDDGLVFDARWTFDDGPNEETTWPATTEHWLIG